MHHSPGLNAPPLSLNDYTLTLMSNLFYYLTSMLVLSGMLCGMLLIEEPLGTTAVWFTTLHPVLQYIVGSEAKGSNSNFANFTGERKNIITLLNSVEFS